MPAVADGPSQQPGGGDRERVSRRSRRARRLVGAPAPVLNLVAAHGPARPDRDLSSVAAEFRRLDDRRDGVIHAARHERFAARHRRDRAADHAGSTR